MQKNDISLGTALILLVVMLGAFLCLKNYETIMVNWEAIIKTVELDQTFLLILISSLLANIFVVSLVADRALGYKKQGSRLRSIKKDKEPKSSIILKSVISIIIGFVLIDTIKTYAILNSKSIQLLLNKELYLGLLDIFTYSLCLLSTVTSYSLLSLFSKVSGVFNVGARLPRISTKKNHLTLGSIGEEKNEIDKIKRPTWVKIPKKALNGNILVTGSIGTGKTQGTIIAYVKQIFRQFDTKPSALVLDPKGSFIPEVVNILYQNNLEKKIVYLGDVNANI